MRFLGVFEPNHSTMIQNEENANSRRFTLKCSGDSIMSTEFRARVNAARRHPNSDSGGLRGSGQFR